MPNYKNGVYGMNQTVINEIFPALLPEIASELTAHKTLDIFDCMGGVNLTHPELIADGCHPNAAGCQSLGRSASARPPTRPHRRVQTAPTPQISSSPTASRSRSASEARPPAGGRREQWMRMQSR